MLIKGMTVDSMSIIGLEEKLPVGVKCLYHLIQSMMKCRYPTANTDLIPYIARALLVEESVLYSGVGKSWGTWAYQLDTSFIKTTMDNSNQRGMVSKMREDVREGIIEVIRSDENLQEYLKKVEDFPYPAQREIYAEETIHLHSDRRLRMCYLREKESLYILPGRSSSEERVISIPLMPLL